MWRLATILTASSLAGCTIVGTAVGSGIPTYETVAPDRAAAIEPQARIQVTLVGGETIEGVFAGVRDRSIVIDTAHGRREVRREDVERIRAQNGTEWATGLVSGVAIDVSVATGLLIAIAARSSASGTSGASR